MTPAPTAQRSMAGRPEATSHGEIEQAAFRLFAERGFEATTLDAIAEAVGVSRRTLFRYYPSKNDIPWGQFDRTLESFRQILRDPPQDRPLHEVVQRGVLAFNDFDDSANPPHRERMRLILETPALQAHSALRYQQWRAVIAEYVAERTRRPADGLLPQTVGHVALALAIAAYEQWLADDSISVTTLLTASLTELRDYLSEDARPS